MNLFQAAVLGVTQGASEFAPISSSGHLIIVPWLAGWKDVLADKDFNKTFDVALHLGTFVGAALYLRKDLWRLIRAWFSSVRARAVRNHDERMAWFLVLSAIPGAVAGAVGEDVINRHLGQPWQIAILLAVFGVLLYVIDRGCASVTSYDELTGRQATAMGFAQALALAPGVSRSGVTITAARATGVTRDTAARFSFLMSLPIIFGAVVFSGSKLVGKSDAFHGQGGAFVVGIVFSAITGALAVWGVLSFVRQHSFRAFTLYRLAVAAGILVVIATGARSGTI